MKNLKNIYLAGPFFDSQQLKIIQAVEGALANNRTVQAVFSPRKGTSSKASDVGSSRWAKATFEEDLKELKKADVVVAILDYPHANPDSGTAFEIGYAYHQGMPIILLQLADNPVNIMLSQAARAYLTTTKELKDYDFDTLTAHPYQGQNF